MIGLSGHLNPCIFTGTGGGNTQGENVTEKTTRFVAGASM